MDRDVEMTLTSQMAGLIATVNAMDEKLDRVEIQTTKTNGRLLVTEGKVSALETAHKISLAVTAATKDQSTMALTWKTAAAALGFAVLMVGGTVAVLSFLGMLQ